VRRWSLEAMEDLRGALEATDWDVLCEPHGDDIDSMVDCVTDYINFCVDNTIPTKDVHCFSNNKPWITSDLKALLNDKKRAFRRGDKEEVKRVQRELKQKLRESKDAYRRRVEDKLQRNRVRDVWSSMREITGFKQAGGATEGNLEMANELNQFFNRQAVTIIDEPVSLPCHSLEKKAVISHSFVRTASEAEQPWGAQSRADASEALRAQRVTVQETEVPAAVGIISAFGLVFTVSLFAWICCQRKSAKSNKTPPYKFVHMLKGVDIYPESLNNKKNSPELDMPSPHGCFPEEGREPASPESVPSSKALTPADKPPDREAGLGTLFFSLEYNFDKKAFIVNIKEAHGLSAMDEQSLTSDPYVKMTILPDKKYKVKTRVLRKTLDPAFDETFSFYGIPYSRVPELALHFMVLSFDRFSRDDVIGEALVPLAGVDLSEGRVLMTREIIKRNVRRCVGRGELLLSLCYQSTTSTLTVVVLKARHLPKTEASSLSDPYVKVNLYQGRKRVCKKKTHVKKSSPNPVFNELFVFDIPPETGLSDTSVELLLLDSDRLARNQVIGRLLLGANAEGTVGEHWREICDHPRRQIAKWHTLSEG
ncbi:SYT4 protein, partial [Atractosteus spatula]|nr:SYT4 protein [Atractosteus spatula]